MNHGNHYHDRNARCVDDPSKWCNMETQEEYMTPDQYRCSLSPGKQFFG